MSQNPDQHKRLIISPWKRVDPCVCVVLKQCDPLLMLQFVSLIDCFVQFGHNLFNLLASKGVSALT